LIIACATSRVDHIPAACNDTRQPPIEEIKHDLAAAGRRGVAGTDHPAWQDQQLFAEVGYEAATTNEIAARAHTSIGSLYQFFPNKEAILHAVAERYHAGMLAVYDALLTSDIESVPLEELVERLIEVLIAFGDMHIGFSRIILQAPPNTQLASAASALLRDMIGRLDRLLATRAPWLTSAQRTLYATIGLTAVNALLSLGIAEKQASNEDDAHQVMEPAKVVLIAYLNAVIVSHEGSAKRR
jgi:AcrR family transcriptional regulator